MGSSRGQAGQRHARMPRGTPTTTDELRRLITQGENVDVRVQGRGAATSFRPGSGGGGGLSRQSLASTPGWLLTGVEDDGRVTGARPRHESGITDVNRVAALVANNTRPSLAVDVHLLRLDGRDVLAIEVPAARTPVGTADGRYLRRAVGADGRPSCIPFHFDEMLSHQADRGAIDYSALVVPGAHWDDLDPLEFERMRRYIRERRGRSDETLLELSDVDLAKALGAVEADGDVHAVRVVGLLLFGREEALYRPMKWRFRCCTKGRSRSTISFDTHCSG
jgi:ATP-dependent DNA helicase RecG